MKVSAGECIHTYIQGDKKTRLQSRQFVPTLYKEKIIRSYTIPVVKGQKDRVYYFLDISKYSIFFPSHYFYSCKCR